MTRQESSAREQESEAGDGEGTANDRSRIAEQREGSVTEDEGRVEWCEGMCRVVERSTEEHEGSADDGSRLYRVVAVSKERVALTTPGQERKCPTRCQPRNSKGGQANKLAIEDQGLIDARVEVSGKRIND